MKILCCIFTVRKTFLEILPLVLGICWRRATYLGRTALSTHSTIEATVVFFLHIFCNVSFRPWFLVSICTLGRVLYRTDIPLHEFFNLVMTYKSSLHSSSVLQDPLPGDLVLSACLCACFGWSFKGLMFADVVLWLPYFTDGYVMTSIY